MLLSDVGDAPHPSALIHYDITIQQGITGTETGESWRRISCFFVLVSVLRSSVSRWETPSPATAPLPPSGWLPGGRSSETELGFHVIGLHKRAEMLIRGCGNETAIKMESQSFYLRSWNAIMEVVSSMRVVPRFFWPWSEVPRQTLN